MIPKKRGQQQNKTKEVNQLTGPNLSPSDTVKPLI